MFAAMYVSCKGYKRNQHYFFFYLNLGEENYVVCSKRYMKRQSVNGILNLTVYLAQHFNGKRNADDRCHWG